MKLRIWTLAIFSLLMIGATSVRADVVVRVGDEAWLGYRRPYYAPYYYYPYYPYHPFRRIWFRPYRVVAYVPAAAPAVAYAPNPVNVEPSASVSLTGNYADDVAALHGRLARMRGVLQRQHEKGILDQGQYDRLMNALEGIEHDQHARAYDHDGNLTPEDLNALLRRCDQVNQDMEVALAQ